VRSHSSTCAECPSVLVDFRRCTPTTSPACLAATIVSTCTWQPCNHLTELGRIYIIYHLVTTGLQGQTRSSNAGASSRPDRRLAARGLLPGHGSGRTRVEIGLAVGGPWSNAPVRFTPGLQLPFSGMTPFTSMIRGVVGRYLSLIRTHTR
jgi:hypothetical protein